MEYKIKKLAKSEVEITITVSDEEVEKNRKKACEDISQDVKVDGFRKGHIPREILEKHVDKAHIDAHTQELAMQRAYAEVVVKEKLQVVSRPRVKVEEEKPFKFTATVAILPEVEVKDYTSIKVKKGETKVTEKDVEEVIAELKKHSTIYKEVDRKAENGDRVEVDFAGFEGDKAVPGTDSKNHPIILGEKTMIPGFEEEIVGMEKGKEKTFDIVFPETYHKIDFRKKKVTFKVKLHRVEVPEVPELSEEMIEKLTGKKLGIEEFKEDVKKNIEAKKEQEAKQKQENDWIAELLKKVTVEVPETMIEEEVQYIVHDMQRDLESKGAQWDQFLEKAKTNVDELKKKYSPEAERRIKIRLALQHVIRAEKIEVTEEETKVEMEKMKTFYPEDQHAKIQSEYDKGDLKYQLQNRMALHKLFEKVLS